MRGMTAMPRDLPPRDSGTRRREDALSLALVLAFCVVLFVSCWLVSARKPFWFDELLTAYALRSSLDVFVMGLGEQIDLNPPLYSVVAWIWSQVFGVSELATRALSSLMLASAVIVMWSLLSRRFHPVVAALSACLALAATLLSFEYNAEARMYALFTLTAAIATKCSLTKPREGAWHISLIVAVSLLVYSHLFGILYAAALLFGHLLADTLYRSWRPALYRGILAGMSTIVFYYPLFRGKMGQASDGSWIPPVFVGDIVDFYRLIVPVPVDRFGFYGGALLVAAATATMIAIAASHAAGHAASRIKSDEAVFDVRAACIATAFLAMPFAVALISVVWRPVFISRYMIASQVGLAIAYAFCFDALWRKIRRRRWSMALLPAVILGPLAVTAATFGNRALHYSEYKPGATDRALMPLNIPVVVGFSGLFVSRLEYAAEPERYYFWLDWEMAHRAESGDFAPEEYRTLPALARQHPELFRNVVNFDEFVRDHDDFYVLRRKSGAGPCRPPDNYNEKWRNFYCWTRFDGLSETYTMDRTGVSNDGAEVWYVRRK